MIKDWRFWLGALGSLVGLWLYSIAHQLAARNWVASIDMARRNPDGPPANVSHGWGMPAPGTEGYFWSGLVLMFAGVAIMLWSAKRSRAK